MARPASFLLPEWISFFVLAHDEYGVGPTDEFMPLRSVVDEPRCDHFASLPSLASSCSSGFGFCRAAINIICLYIRAHFVSIENDDSITPSQCRGARAILNMTQPDLAQAAHLGLSTVVDFERTRREVSIEAIGALRSALERRGIIFISENGGGPGVRLRDRESPKRSRSKKE
jgi:DNA-binding XRE family transcriptional regulator